MSILVSPNLAEFDRGSNWQEGERIFGFTSQNSAPLKVELNLGTKVEPDTGIQPGFAISRVINAKAGTWSGDGQGQLAAFRVGILNVESSEGQAVAGAFSAITEGSHENGANELADAFALTAAGISRKGTRTGGGLYVEGRRETAEGRATGIECVIDNNAESATEEFTGAFPKTKGIHLHTIGNSGGAVGLLASNVGQNTHTLIGAMTGAKISGALIADYSEAPISYDIRGKRGTAIRVLKEAGTVLVGTEALTGESPPQLMEIHAGGIARTPLLKLTAGANANITQIFNNSTANFTVGLAGAAGGLMTGSAIGDGVISAASTKILHLGRSAATADLKLGGGVGFYGTAPVAKPIVSGAKAGNAALESLVSKLAELGLITNSTT
jgi:hypothetical protein